MISGNVTYAAEKQAPAEVVAEFYKWYLHEEKGNHEPVVDERAKLSTYVSKRLLYRIDQHEIESGSDYIIKAQDYFDDWEDSIVIKSSKVTGNSASVTFTMGTTKNSFSKFTVTMCIEDHAWKILSINDDIAAGGK